jgi:hypothetical protein
MRLPTGHRRTPFVCAQSFREALLGKGDHVCGWIEDLRGSRIFELDLAEAAFFLKPDHGADRDPAECLRRLLS